MSLETPSIATNSPPRAKIPILPQKRQSQQKNKDLGREVIKGPTIQEIDITGLRRNVKDLDAKVLKKALITTNLGTDKRRNSSGLGYLDTEKLATTLDSNLQSIRDQLDKTKENIDQL